MTTYSREKHKQEKMKRGEDDGTKKKRCTHKSMEFKIIITEKKQAARVMKKKIG